MDQYTQRRNILKIQCHKGLCSFPIEPYISVYVGWCLCVWLYLSAKYVQPWTQCYLIKFNKSERVNRKFVDESFMYCVIHFICFVHFIDCKFRRKQTITSKNWTCQINRTLAKLDREQLKHKFISVIGCNKVLPFYHRKLHRLWLFHIFVSECCMQYHCVCVRVQIHTNITMNYIAQLIFYSLIWSG